MVIHENSLIHVGQMEVWFSFFKLMWESKLYICTKEVTRGTLIIIIMTIILIIAEFRRSIESICSAITKLCYPSNRYGSP